MEPRAEACPTRDELEALVEGRTSRPDSERLAEHASSCESCAGDLAAARADHELAGELARASAGALPPNDAAAQAAPAALGRYTLTRKLAEGGMGVVWEAEQVAPRRRVALKLIRPDRVAESTLRRFEVEVEALARLEHPGIARIYDAGTFEVDGRAQPFFAMELVDGLGLVEHARSRRLDLRARVTLLARVADAVQHAHQRGVLHRDLKPSNVLVRPNGQPVVLDFGIARTLDNDAGVGAQATEAGQVIGTLAYSSPEQLAADPGAVDARTDVHGLGGLLYELLAGRAPYDLDGLSVAQAARAIEEREPEVLGRVDRALAGDLEVIAAKALARDPERRYASAAAVADDLRRWLARRPVEARAPSTLYVLSRWARRNRLASALAAGALVVSVVGVVATWGQSLRARRAEAAERARAEELAHEIGRLAVLNDFYIGLLDSANLKRASQGADYTVLEALRTAAAELEAEPPGDARSEAELHRVIGEAFSSLSEHDEALVHLRRAVELRRAEGDTSRELAGGLNALSAALHDAGHLDQAEETALEALAIYGRLVDVPDEWLVPRRATTLSNLGMLHLEREQYDRAEELIEEALALHRSVLGDGHLAVANDLAYLAGVVWRRGDRRRGLELQREAVAVNDGLPDPSATVALSSKATLATMLLRLGQYEESVAVATSALEIAQQSFGRRHPQTITALVNLANARYVVEDYGVTLDLAVEALELWDDDMGERTQLVRALEIAAAAAAKLGLSEEEAQFRARLSALGGE